MPPGILPLPPRQGRAFPPILVICLILCFLKALQGRQRFFEVRAMPYRHRVGPHKIRTYPPIATVYVEFFLCGNVGVVLVREFVHFANHFISATQFKHGLSEPCITNEPIVNVRVSSFPALFFELICSVVFSITFFLSVSVTVWSALPDVKVRNGEKVKNGLDVLPCFLSYHLERSARTCSRRCPRPSTTDTLCTVLWVQHRVVRTVQCFQLL